MSNRPVGTVKTQMRSALQKLRKVLACYSTKDMTMHGCRGCQERMLDHLYDLLDEAEQAIPAHLSGCPACQAGLEKACAEQRLLAAAARK